MSVERAMAIIGELEKEREKESILMILKRIEQNLDSLNKDVVYLSGKLGEHDLIIDRFKRRIDQHETDLEKMALAQLRSNK